MIFRPLTLAFAFMLGASLLKGSPEYMDRNCIQQIRFTKPGKVISPNVAQFDRVQVEFACVSFDPKAAVGDVRRSLVVYGKPLEAKSK